MVLDVRNLVPGQSKALLGKSEKAEKKRKQENSTVASAGSSEQDSVKITGQANQINRLVQQMKSEPVLDPDRVSPVKEKLAKGDYELKYEQIANKMLDFESSYYGY